MTSLALQLKALSTAASRTVFEEDAHKVSLLFDPSEIGKHDKDSIFAIGLGGLEELCSINSVFEEFKNSLFSNTATDVQRLVLTADSNAAINKTVRKFLIFLSPYFLLRSAHKALEWLIYRYKVAEYNMDDMLMIAFPYHDHNIFVRLSQVFNLKDRNNKWHWLSGMRMKGTKMPASAVAMHAYKDIGFFNMVASMPYQFIDVFNGVQGHEHAAHIAISFYTKIVLMALKYAPEGPNTLVPVVVPYLTQGLNSSNEELKCSSYMTLAMCASKFTLEADLVTRILKVLMKTMTENTCFQALSALVVVTKNQKAPLKIDSKVLKVLCGLKSLPEALLKLNEVGKTVLDKFWLAFLPPLITEGIHNAGDGKRKSSAYKLLEALISSFDFSEEVVVLAVRRLFWLYKDGSGKSETTSSQETDVIAQFLRLLETRFCEFVEPVLALLINPGDAAKTIDADPISRQFALLSVTAFKHEPISGVKDESINVMLAVNHPDSSMRRLGLEKIFTVLKQQEDEEASDKEFISSSFYSRLLDDDLSIVSFILDSVSLDTLQSFLSVEQLFNVLNNTPHWAVLSKPIYRMLCQRVLSEEQQLEMHAIVLVSAQKARFTTVEVITNKKDIESPKKAELAAFKYVAKAWGSKRLPEKIEQLLKKEDTDLIFIMAPLLEYLLDNLAKQEDLLSPLMVSKILRHLVTVCGLVVKLRGKKLFEKESETKRQREVTKTFEAVRRVLDTHFCSAKSFKRHLPSYLSILALLVQASLSESVMWLCSQWMKKNLFGIAIMLFTSQPEQYSAVALNLLGFLALVVTSHYKVLSQHGRPSLNQVTFSAMALSISPLKPLRQQAIQALNGLSKQNCPCMSTLVRTIVEHKRLIKDEKAACKAISPLFTVKDKSPAAQSELQSLLSKICDENTPATLATLLLQLLQDVPDKLILMSLIPLMTRLSTEATPSTALLKVCISRFGKTVAKQIGSEIALSNLLKVFLVSHPQIVMPQLAEKLGFTGLDEDLQRELLVTMIDVYRKSAVDREIQSQITDFFAKVHLTSSVMMGVYEDIIAARGSEDTVKAKKRKTVALARKTGEVHPLEKETWSRSVLLLTWLQNKELQATSDMVTSMFTLLQIANEMKQHELLDYTKQIVCGALQNVLEQTLKAGESLTEENMNLEAVVHCIRTSTNPQTHQQVLLLLRTAADIFPDLVLDHIMAIFTYMGTNIMRQDDLFSHQIISKTLETVIPVLTKSNNHNSIIGVIRVFMDSFPHIPVARRMPLFVKLIETVGLSGSYLQACAALAIEAKVCLTRVSVHRPSADSAVPMDVDEGKKANDPLSELAPPLPNEHSDFMIDLFSQFSIEIQMTACAEYIEYLTALPVTKPTLAPAQSQKSNRKASNLGLFDVFRRTDKQLRQYRDESCDFLVELLSGDQFVSQVVFAEENDVSLLESSFKSVVEATLCHITSVAIETGRNANTILSKYWKTVLHKSYEMLDKVNSLLPMKGFIGVIESLLSHDLILIKRKALDLFNNRLAQTKYKENELENLFGLLINISKIAFDKGGDGGEDDLVLKQTALYSLKLIVRLLEPGSNETHQGICTKLLHVAMKQLSVVVVGIKSSILLLVGELVGLLKDLMLEFIPTTFPVVLGILSEPDISSSGRELYWISAITCMTRFVSNISKFLSPHLRDIINVVARHSLEVSRLENTTGYMAHLPSRLKSLRQGIAHNFPSRILAPVLMNVLTQSSDQPLYQVEDTVPCLMGIVGDHIDHISAAELNINHNELLVLLMTGLNFRQLHPDDNPTRVNDAEDKTINALISMVFKLSETSFRPMYFKLYDWAVQTGDCDERLITFYRLSFRLAETLKSLFGLFAGHIVSNMGAVLLACSKQYNSTPESLSEASNEGELPALFKGQEYRKEKLRMLSLSVMDCLLKILQHDASGFMIKTRFDALTEPLVTQLGVLWSDYDVMLNQHITPCITQLALSADDESICKPLLYQICMRSTEKSPVIRKATLSLIKELCSKLGDGFNPLLPEAVPFLAELMEDEDDEVETYCQQVIAEMELTLGESLQKYF